MPIQGISAPSEDTPKIYYGERKYTLISGPIQDGIQDAGTDLLCHFQESAWHDDETEWAWPFPADGDACQDGAVVVHRHGETADFRGWTGSSREVSRKSVASCY